MKSVCFSVKLPAGDQVAVGVGESVVGLLDAAKTARTKGLALIDGEAVPIIGGVVFSTAHVGPVFEFSCQAGEVRKRK